MSATAPKPFSRLLIEVAVGATLGFVLSTLEGPALIKLLYEPPSKDAFSCAGTVQTALSQFVKVQLGCAALGGIGLALVLFFGRRFLRKRREAKSTA